MNLRPLFEVLGGADRHPRHPLEEAAMFLPHDLTFRTVALEDGAAAVVARLPVSGNPQPHLILTEDDLQVLTRMIGQAEADPATEQVVRLKEVLRAA